MPRKRKIRGEYRNGNLTVQEPEVTPIEVISEEAQPLTKEEREDLEYLEAQVIGAVLEAAKALWEINTRRLYRERYATFAEYCEDTFKFSSRYIYYQVKFGQFLNILEQYEQSVHILPQSEYQVRPLSKLKEESAQVEAWLEAVKRAEGKLPSFPVVEEVVREKLTPKVELKKEKPLLAKGAFCQVDEQLSQVIASADSGYELKLWNASEITVAGDEVRELKIDKRSRSRVQLYFDRLGVAASLVERYREKTATDVLGILAKVKLPPTELEARLLKCLERELSRRKSICSDD